MTKQRQRKPKDTVALGNEAERSEISRTTEEQAGDWTEEEKLNEYEPEDEAGLGIQIVDLDEEIALEKADEQADEDEEELDEELAEDLLDEDEEVEEADTGSVYTAVSPMLTSGDVDADWKRAEVTGEETPGGTVSTPDQDVVDNIGRAAGVVYADDEPLDFAEKVGRRDRERWELDPSSIDPDTRALDNLAEEEDDERAKEKTNQPRR